MSLSHGSAGTADIAEGRTPGFLLVTGVAIVLTAILVALGVWQVHRLAWKNNLVAMVESRTTATPVPLPPEADWPALQPDDYNYRHVTLAGRFEHDKEVHIFRPLYGARGPLSGVGDLVLTPFRLDSGAVVIINRGFVPEDHVDPTTRQAGQTEGPQTITGLMRPPEAATIFTPAPELNKRLWFNRDPSSIAATFGLTRVAPFTIDQDASAVPGGMPQGGETVLSFPNNHLSYALTWFGSAAAVVLAYGVYVWRRVTGVRPAK